MAKTAPAEPSVFVIRIWVEPHAAGGGVKRGYVEHLATGQRRYFSELIDALEFIAALGAMPLAGRWPSTGDDGGPAPSQPA